MRPPRDERKYTPKITDKRERQRREEDEFNSKRLRMWEDHKRWHEEQFKDLPGGIRPMPMGPRPPEPRDVPEPRTEGATLKGECSPTFRTGDGTSSGGITSIDHVH
jgi:hypothetical protein